MSLTALLLKIKPKADILYELQVELEDDPILFSHLTVVFSWCFSLSAKSQSSNHVAEEENVGN